MDMGDGIGGMSMGDGMPTLFHLQKMYWAVVGTAIGCAALINIYNKIIYRQRYGVTSQTRIPRLNNCRMSSACRKDPTPSKPRAIIPSLMATLAALAREMANFSCHFPLSKDVRWNLPPLGHILLVSAELVLVLVLCFYRLNPRDQWQWEDIAYRTGFIAAAQLPLIVLLAGKRNLIGLLIGTSYERLNWLHRWISRILFLTVTIHMGFWFADWARYDYIKIKLTTDPITQRGFAAWCILLWICLGSLAPVRRWNYEVFVAQHVVTFVGFFAAVYLHLPKEVRVWVWLSISLFLLDRCLRAVWTLRINLSCVVRRDKSSHFLACKATFEPLDIDTMRIIVRGAAMKWQAGQHVFLSCHSLVPLQAHPFTIASIPEDGKIELLVKSKSGGTKRLLRYAERTQRLPIASGNMYRYSGEKTVVLEGPYGRIRPLRQFDSVFLIAGSSGATFIVPLLRDLVLCWKKIAFSRKDSWNHAAFAFRGAATRHVRFVWVIKSRHQYEWFQSQLSQVMDDVDKLKTSGHHIEVDISIYITCDDTLEVVRHGMSPVVHCAPATDAESADCLRFDEVKLKGDIASVPSMSSNMQVVERQIASCGPNGGCCCREIVEDEDKALESRKQCHCSCKADSIEAVPEDPSINAKGSSLAPDWDTEVKPPTHAPISILFGRPKPKSLIRKTLELALGESAIAVCGPAGLVDDVKQSVVALSDERAVHKGSGAQGIYLHAEAFEY